MSTLDDRLARQLEQRIQDGNFRKLAPPQGGVDFYSNDYLGIARDGLPNSLLPAMSLPSGSTGSRLISGNLPLFEELEAQIARHHGAEAALVYNSGYDANIGLITAVAGRHTYILYDELCHASIIDGIRASICKGKHPYRHNDTADLARLLEKQQATEILVITESVFSMDGDQAPLQAIVDICKSYGAHLIVDEAHATGVFGSRGEGLVSMLHLERKVFARVHTFGKALGGHGAAIVANEQLVSYLVNFSRPFIYTTALPPHAVTHALRAYQFMNSDAFSNTHLHELITYFRQRIAGQPGWLFGTSPVQVLVVGSNASSKEAEQRLRENGIDVKAIKSPTVPAGSERLRICLHAFNTRQEIDKLLSLLLP